MLITLKSVWQEHRRSLPANDMHNKILNWSSCSIYSSPSYILWTLAKSANRLMRLQNLHTPFIVISQYIATIDSEEDDERSDENDRQSIRRNFRPIERDLLVLPCE